MNHFSSRVANVETEVRLPFGKGAVDVVVNKSGEPTRYIEVKSHPCSINQKGVREQFGKYEKYFPGGSYSIAFPTEDGRMLLIDAKTGDRTFLD